MLKDDISKLNEELRKKNELKQKKADKRRERIESSLLYKSYQNYLKKKEEKQLKKYDKETEKFISKLPKKLVKYAKKYKYIDIYIYKYSYFISPLLYPNLARTYLDKRGHKIVKFLEENEIEYRLHTHNYDLSSYYSIRVYF